MTLSQTYISRKQLLVDNLVAKGVTGYTVNDGLTTLINAVLEIQGGGTRTLTLTSDKDILSYADSESATLTATLLEDGVGVSGATVEFFNGSTSLGTAQTDSTGVATKTYNSTGAGDISLTASDGTLVSEIFSIEDCHYYNGNTLTSNTSFNVALPSDNYEISFKVKRPSSSGNTAYIQLNNDSRIVSLVGQVGGGGVNQMRCYTSTSNFSDYAINNTPLNSEVELVFSKQDTSFTYTMGESSTSMNCTQTFAKLYNASISGGNYIKELKVKLL